MSMCILGEKYRNKIFVYARKDIATHHIQRSTVQPKIIGLVISCQLLETLKRYSLWIYCFSDPSHS